MATSAEKATYTLGHHSSVVNSHARRTAQDSAAFLLPHLKPNFTVLDLGCGPGTITADLALLVPQGKVTGIDFSEAVIENARSHAQGRGINNCIFETVDANKLPYADASFDVVFCHQVLQHVSDPVAILKEMRRVAKPGGIVAAREADYKSFAWYPEPAGLDFWLASYQKTARACGGEPNAGRYLRLWAKQAGLLPDESGSNLISSWSEWFYLGEPAVKFGESWKDRALKSDFAKEFVARGFGSEAELQGISSAWEDWATVEDCFIVIPSGEILYRVPAPGEH